MQLMFVCAVSNNNYTIMYHLHLNRANLVLNICYYVKNEVTVSFCVIEAKWALSVTVTPVESRTIYCYEVLNYNVIISTHI